MKRFVSCLLVASVLTSSGVASASEPVVTPLVKGQPAPYSGVLMSPEAVAKVVAEKDAVDELVQIEVKRQADLAAAVLKYEVDRLTATCDADKKILQAQVDDGKRQVEALNEELKKRTSGSNSTLWAGLGATGGIVVTLLTVFAVSQVTK